MCASADGEASDWRAEVEELTAFVHKSVGGWITVASWPKGERLRTIALLRVRGGVTESDVLKALREADKASDAESLPRVLRGLLLATAEATYAREQKWLHQKTFLLNDAARRLAIDTFEGFFHQGHACAQIFLDIDNFKSINGRLGYTEADRVADVVAKGLRTFGNEEHAKAAGGGLLNFHVSGDEFKILAWKPLTALGTSSDSDAAASAAMRELATTAIACVGSEATRRARELRESEQNGGTPDEGGNNTAREGTEEEAINSPVFLDVLKDLGVSAGVAVLHDGEPGDQQRDLIDELDARSERGLEAAKRNGKKRAFLSEEALARGGVVTRVRSGVRVQISIGSEDGVRKDDLFDAFARPDADLEKEQEQASEVSTSDRIGYVKVYHVSGREARAHIMEGVSGAFEQVPALRLREPRGPEHTRLYWRRTGSDGLPAMPCRLCEEAADIEIFRTELARGFGSKYPLVEGHVLVVPLRHCVRVQDLNPDEYDEMMRRARDVSLALEAELSAPGIKWSLQDGAAAGQEIGHVHLHLIPRHFSDGLGNEESGRLRPEATRAQLCSLASRLQARLKLDL